MIKPTQLGHHGHAKTPDGAAIATRLAAYWRASIAAQKSAARIHPSPEPWAALVQKSVDACADMAKIPSP